MKSNAKGLYIRRKIGFGMDFRYILARSTPLILVFLITSVLVFALVFISSISNAIDRMIVLLGSGSLSFSEEVDSALLPNGSSIDMVKRGEGILYSEDGESLVYLKGVDEGYFNEQRKNGLYFSGSFSSSNWIVLSSNLAKSLSVDIGDRMTLLLYESEKGRTRPILVNITGIFDSGYAQLDRYLAYCNISMIDTEKSTYELLLPEGVDIDRVQSDLFLAGYSSISYKSEYSSLYANVQQSIWILYIILIAVALLSAFFSTDIAQVYLSQDRQDIALLFLLGMNRKAILSIYLYLVLFAVFIANLLGIVFGILLGYLSPYLVKAIAYFDLDMLEYYIASFSIDIPYLRIFVMLLLMLALAFVSLVISLSRYDREELLLLVNNT